MPLLSPWRSAHTLIAERTGEEPDNTVQGCWQGSDMRRMCGHTAHTDTHPLGCMAACCNRGDWLKLMHAPACLLPACNNNNNNNSDTTQNCRAVQRRMPIMTTSNPGQCKKRDAMGCLFRHGLRCPISCCLPSSTHSVFVPVPGAPATGRHDAWSAVPHTLSYTHRQP